MTRPLAARFDDPDDAARLAAYLDTQAATPFWRERKQASIELLRLRPGAAALDVGCGTGDDVRAMAALVGERGIAVGVDASAELIAEAQRRARDGERAAFHVADAAALPFGDEEFDGVRVERVLQHLRDPAAAVAEMVRVARRGAWLVAVEPDWTTMRLEPGGAEIAQRWAGAIRQPDIGARLAALFPGAQTRSDVSVITDAAFAEEQFGLSELAPGWEFARAEVTYVTAWVQRR